MKKSFFFGVVLLGIGILFHSCYYPLANSYSSGAMYHYGQSGKLENVRVIQVIKGGLIVKKNNGGIFFVEYPFNTDVAAGKNLIGKSLLLETMGALSLIVDRPKSYGDFRNTICLAAGAAPVKLEAARVVADKDHVVVLQRGDGQRLAFRLPRKVSRNHCDRGERLSLLFTPVSLVLVDHCGDIFQLWKKNDSISSFSNWKESQIITIVDNAIIVDDGIIVKKQFENWESREITSTADQVEKKRVIKPIDGGGLIRDSDDKVIFIKSDIGSLIGNCLDDESIHLRVNGNQAAIVDAPGHFETRGKIVRISSDVLSDAEAAEILEARGNRIIVKKYNGETVAFERPHGASFSDFSVGKKISIISDSFSSTVMNSSGDTFEVREEKVREE